MGQERAFTACSVRIWYKFGAIFAKQNFKYRPEPLLWAASQVVNSNGIRFLQIVGIDKRYSYKYNGDIESIVTEQTEVIEWIIL